MPDPRERTAEDDGKELDERVDTEFPSAHATE